MTKYGSRENTENHSSTLFCHSRLRTPLYGYWPFVKEFSHEETTREIISLPKVNSNLGYGRAWLLGALQSGLVVCYFQSFVYNRKLVTKYYLDNALLRDTLVSL